jgi:hypothetical protein
LYLNGVGLAADFDVDKAEAFMNQIGTDTDLAVGVVASKLSTYTISFTVTMRSASASKPASCVHSLSDLGRRARADVSRSSAGRLRKRFGVEQRSFVR